MWVKSSSDHLMVTIHWEVTLFVSMGGSLISVTRCQCCISTNRE